MELDDVQFCLGTYLSEQLADGCTLQQQENLLAKVQLSLTDCHKQSATLAVDNAPLLKEGQARLAHAQSQLEKIKEREEQSQKTLQSIEEQFVSIQSVQRDLECVDGAQDYVKLLTDVKHCSNDAKDIVSQQKSQKHPETNSTQQPEQIDYSKLESIYRALKGVVTSFTTTFQSNELRTMLRTRMRLLLAECKPQILEIVHTLLKAAGWPQAPKRAPTELVIALRCTLLIQKIELELNDDNIEIVMCGPNSLLGLMLKPIALRFRFHFSDKQASNRVDKPEWMTAFLLQVITDHSSFIVEEIQPLVTQCDIHRNVLPDFIRATYDLARGKFERQLTQLAAVSDMPLFSHIVDELIAFEKKLQESHFPTPGLIGVLTKASLFKQWQAVDKQAMEEGFEALRELSHSWDPLQQQGGPVGLERKSSKILDGEGVVATVAGDAFLALLSRFSERYTVLPNLDLRLRFLETVQIKAVKRFLQLLNSNLEEQLSQVDQNKTENWRMSCGLLSTVHYVIISLKEWGESEQFLELALHQAQCRALEQGQTFQPSEYFPSAFEGSIELYSQLLTDSTQQLIDTIVDSFQTRSRKFHLINDCKVSLGGAILNLKWQLSQLSAHLSGSSVYRNCLRGVGFGLDQLLFGLVAEESSFNSNTAAQFVSDMQTLWSLFPNPQEYFPYLRDAVTLLSMSVSDLQKLAAHLANLSQVDHRAVLAVHSIFRLDRLQVVALLSRLEDR